MYQMCVCCQKSWSRKFCALFDTSPQGVRRLELFDSEDQFEKNSGGKILVLEDAVKVQMTSRKDNAKDGSHAHHKDSAYHLFEITTEKQSVRLRAESSDELKEWVDRIRKVAFPDKNQSIMNHHSNAQQSNNMNNNNNNNSESSKPTGYAVKENDLYGAVEDTFCVKLVGTPASEKCGLDPTELNYVITLTTDSMILKYGDLNNLYANDEQTNKIIFEWNYAYIRRYGIVSGFFSFEAGRKCPSGEGLFSFDAPDVRKIFECLASYMKLAGEKRRQMKTAGAPTQPPGTGTPPTGSVAGGNDTKVQGKPPLRTKLSGRACAVPQTPVSSTAVYANISDPDPVTNHPTSAHHAASTTAGLTSATSKQIGSSGLLSAMGGVPVGVPPVEHIVVGDGVEYARVVKTQPGPPPPPPAQKVNHLVPITRMESVETLKQGSC
ncbi:hypothetical protein BIW11_01031 [Tropilaelaps mercedesae]|uniref:Uncharacterized protein n=1 Tax=Tropilaelaps mercedesae TaxID=418985 RepID=A0A1V9XKJ9_9ACAR|nr:hypothetical protein BIW11_01031 [Tropilaelaps mercedesae]